MAGAIELDHAHIRGRIALLLLSLNCVSSMTFCIVFMVFFLKK
jgi:hypothetical protein